MTNLLTFPADDTDDVAIELDPTPSVEIEPDPAELAIEPDATAPPAITEALATTPFIEVLPADFKLPLLTKFVPNAALRLAADQSATYALGVSVEGPEGLQRADLALTTLRVALRDIEQHFEEPTAIANALHKRLTSMRADWQAAGHAAIKTVGGRVYAEDGRLKAIAQEERRKAQAEADQQARDAAKREAAAAEQAQAPAPVVQELQRQAATATAPPVAATTAPLSMRGTSTVTAWKARLAGTPGSDEPNPEIAALSVEQRHQVFALLRAILDGKAPIASIALDWSYLNKRAKADKSTLAIPGIEAFEEGSVRSKGSRSR